MSKYLEWLDLVKEIAPKYDLPVSLVLAIIQIESGGDPSAYNEASGATGLMQVICAEHSPADWNRPPKAELLNPVINIEWGCKILKYFQGVEKGYLIRAMYRYSGGITWLQRATREEIINSDETKKNIAFRKFIEVYWNKLCEIRRATEKSLYEKQAASEAEEYNRILFDDYGEYDDL